MKRVGDQAPHFHAHVQTVSRDCDGEYRSGHTTDVMTVEEMLDAHGDYLFKKRVASWVVDLNSDGLLTVTEDGLDWRQSTEEGYRTTDVTWCEDEGCVDQQSYWRDMTAERAGY